MKFPSLLLTFCRRYIWLACIVGIATATASWLLLPPAPRFHISGRFNEVLSRDFRYLAVLSGGKRTAQGFTLTTTIWDVELEQRLCSFEFDPIQAPDGHFRWGKDIVRAFSEDGKWFLQFWRGKTQFRDSGTGERVKVDLPVEFPFDAKRTSQLIMDAQGRNYVLIKDENNQATIRDLLTGEQTASFSVPSKSEFYTYFPGVLYIHAESGLEVRRIPSGESLDTNAGMFSRGAVTADCNIAAVVTPATSNTAGKVDIQDFRTGDHRVVPMLINRDNSSVLFISPDGRYLGAREDRQHEAPPGPAWLWNWIGVGARKEKVCVLYDLSTGLEAASFSDRTPIFSLDRNQVATVSKDSLEIYDLPVPRPWRRIVGCGALAAGITWLLLYWRTWHRSRSILTTKR